MLSHRLDKEVALVLVSAVDGNSGHVAGAAAAPGMVVSVEHMQKVSQDEARRLTASMSAEWKSVSTVADAAALPSPLSAKGEPYRSEDRAAKLRRLHSEPKSPTSRQLDVGK